MSRVAVLALLLTSFAAFAELPVGQQVIHTRDGRELRGVVISQTEEGYLVQMADRTELVPFAIIQDMLPAEPAAAPPPPPPPLPPQPSADGDQPPPEVTAGPDWRAERRGFHWTLGAGGMVDPGVFSGGGTGASSPIVTGYVAGFAGVRFGLGWIDIQGELMPMGFFRNATKALFVVLNPQVRINFARFYSLGVGIWGAATVIPTVEFVTGFSVSPAIVRLGDEGQHELRFWLASPALATTPGLRAGTILLLLLSYAYVF